MMGTGRAVAAAPTRPFHVLAHNMLPPCTLVKWQRTNPPLRDPKFPERIRSETLSGFVRAGFLAGPPPLW
jgi:hypothetical protein